MKRLLVLLLVIAWAAGGCKSLGKDIDDVLVTGRISQEQAFALNNTPWESTFGVAARERDRVLNQDAFALIPLPPSLESFVVVGRLSQAQADILNSTEWENKHIALPVRAGDPVTNRDVSELLKKMR
jgi:hypothetical protein